MGADKVSYVQFMGKDNVAFHTLSFPTTLIGSGEPWKLVDRLKAFNWVTWYGGKFSTSENRGVFMDAAIELAPSDYWRWHLTANAPEGSDAGFTFEDFAARINSDLANVMVAASIHATRDLKVNITKLVERIGGFENPLNFFSNRN